MALPEDNKYKTSIRFFNASSMQDMRALELMASHLTKNFRHWMADLSNLSRQDIIDWANEKSRKRDEPKLYAVVIEPETMSLVDDYQEVQGFIYAYPEDDTFLLRYMKLQHLVSKKELDKLVFEISYAKHPNGLGGQIAKAVPLVCKDLCNLMQVTVNNKTGNPRLTILAYTYADNIGSVKVLEKSGFERRGSVPESKGSTVMVDLYVLNWQKLTQLI